MKFKVLFLIVTIGFASLSTYAQRGVRIGYIDTEYILQNVPEYQDAASQLDKKVLQWKSEVEKQLKVIELRKKELENEKVLLTKELYEERMEDIAFDEAEILDYQQKRFGPNGDLMIQKRQLIAPVQDQIFAAVQEIAKLKKFDFVFDRSADVVMLYSAERYDISDQVLKTITRASKREQAKTKKERKALEDEDVVPEVDEELDNKRAARQKQLEERKKQQEALREAKKREREERRKKALEARNKAKADKATKTDNKKEDDNNKKEEATKKEETTTTTEVEGEKPKTRAEIVAEINKKKAADRAARKKALQERKKKMLEQRKKNLEARKRRIDSINKAKKAKNN